MGSEKVLGFKIDIEGVSSEAQELAKLELQLKNIKKERAELMKQATSPNHLASNEERQKLAAYNKEIASQEAALKTLKRVVDSASDSLARKKALLIELTAKSDKATQSIRDGMAPAILKLNNEIKAGENARGVFSRNVGNYPQLFQAIPGPVGNAATSINGLVSKLKMLGPAGALIAGGLAAISAPLIAFFTSSENGVEMLERKIAGFRAAINVLKGDLIELGRSMVGEKGDEAIPWGSRLVKGLKLIATTANIIPGVSKYFDDLEKRVKEAEAAGEAYTLIKQELEDSERAMIVPRAQANFQIKEARLIYADDKKSINERIDALKIALDLENKTADEEVKHQQFFILNLRARHELLKKNGQFRDDDDKAMQEAIAKEIDLRTESIGRQLKATATEKKARKDLTDDAKKALDEEESDIRENHENIKKLYKKKWEDLVEQEKLGNSLAADVRKLMGIKDKDLGIQENKEWIESVKRQSKAASDDDMRVLKEDEDKKKALKLAALQGVQMGADAAFVNKKARLQAEMEAELTNVNLTEEETKKIKRKYAKEQQKIDISQAIVNGAIGITKTFAEYGFLPAGWIAAALLAVQTGIQIAVIKAQKFATGGRIIGGLQVHPDTSKDNTLIYAKQGETVLTQKHVQSLGGSAMMRRIKVPGYAEGGYIGQLSPEMPSQGFDIAALAKMIGSIEVKLDINKVNSAQKELSVITETKGI